MTGKQVGMFGMAIGALGMLVAGLIDPYTKTLLLCGSIIFAGGLVAMAIGAQSQGGDS